MFILNLQSKIPIYEQIEEEMQRFIEAGILKPGDKLPSVRSLASENDINPNTVARAYAELEEQGWVCNLPKKGVYVKDRKGDLRKDSLVSMVKTMKDKGYRKEEIMQAIETVYKEEDHAQD